MRLQYLKCGELIHELIAVSPRGVQFLCGLVSHDYPFENFSIGYDELSPEEVGLDNSGEIFSAKVKRAAQSHLNCEVCPKCLAKRLRIMKHEEIARAIEWRGCCNDSCI